MKPAIVFLDIDGVLNSMAYLNRDKMGASFRPEDDVDPARVTILNALIDSVPHVQFVISSSWRHAYPPDRMQAILTERGFRGVVIGATSDRAQDDLGRHSEIREWLAEHAPDAAWVALDDLDMRGKLGDRCVVTDWYEGLTAAHVEQARAILARSP